MAKRIILTALAAALLLVAVPAAADASPRQISIFEDSAAFFGSTSHDPATSIAEAKALGADAVRGSMTWARTSPGAKSRTKPAGFNPADPNSPGYDWSQYDDFVGRARANGLKVILTLSSGAIPYWASNQPSKCPHHIGGYKNLGLSCMWKPNVKLFGEYARAVAQRYKGKVLLYSPWNEPNLEHYLYPQFQNTRYGQVDLGGKQYRELWLSAYKGITKADSRMKNSVLYGETAAISSPIDTLYSALCLNQDGKPYTGMLKKLQGCSKPAKLPIGGLSVHPYNKDAVGNVFTRSFTPDSMALGYVSRATRVLRDAEKYKRVPKGRGVYVTELGFQTNPPDHKGLSDAAQATAINQADRLFFGDPRVRSVAQYELYDAPEVKDDDVFNTGLRTTDGDAKASLAAYRMPLVISKLAKANQVEVWGQVRPAAGRTRPVIEVAAPGGSFKRLSAPLTNPSGYYRFTLTRGNAAKLRYRATWKSPSGDTFKSRVATAGKPIAYRVKP